MDTTRIKSLLETLIFVSEKPLKVSEMLEGINALEKAEDKLEGGGSESAGDEEEVSLEEDLEGGEKRDVKDQLESFVKQEENKTAKSDIVQVVGELEREYQEDPKRGIILTEVDHGWQFVTRPENAAVIQEFFQPKPTKLSKPGLETLSMVAYRQPITRAEIEEIRGVDSGGVLKTLLEKNLVRIVGKKDEPGKPMLYGTTSEFLELFQLKNLKELPSLKDYRDLEEEFNRQSGEEGVVLEKADEEEEKETSLAELSLENKLTPLDEAEEEILGVLDESIKEVRHVEREIFPKEKKEEESAPSQESNSSEVPPTVES